MDLGLDFEGRSKKGQLKIFFGCLAGRESDVVVVIISLKLIPNM